jgi:membrane protease YdiL (CAAX protease family)
MSEQRTSGADVRPRLVIIFLFALACWLIVGTLLKSLIAQFVSPYLAANTPFIVLALALIAAVYLLFPRPPRSLFTDHPRFRIKILLAGFGVYFGISLLFLSLSYCINPTSLLPYRAPLHKRLIFILLALVITPIQTSSEEVLLRILPVRILQPDTLRSSWPVSIISALLFVLPHLSNRELSAGNSALVVVLYYALFALVITMCSLRLGGFELALGVHAANNLFVAIFVNYSGSSLPSTPLWTSLRPVGTIRDLLQLGITLLAIALLTVKLERTIALDQTPPMAHPSA